MATTDRHIALETLTEQTVVQVATPQSVGKGVIWQSEKLIITNAHIVDGNPIVTVRNAANKKVQSTVLYIDEVYDLAFLALPEHWNITPIQLNTTYEREQIIWTNGQALQLDHTKPEPNEITYLKVYSHIDTEDSGAPIFNMTGELLGIHTALMTSIYDESFALPSSYILQALASFDTMNRAVSMRCFNCGTIVSAVNRVNHACPSCEIKLTLPSEEEPYQPEGLCRTIEALIEILGYNAILSRKGPYAWEIEEGSATIEIIYNESAGYVIGDAYLCLLPKNHQQAIYQYLLRQNYAIQGLNFSIREDDIVLSLIIYERDLNHDTGLKLFKHLFDMADYYDNILVEEYGARWKS